MCNSKNRKNIYYNVEAEMYGTHRSRKQGYEIKWEALWFWYPYGFCSYYKTIIPRTWY